jgi:hypothetical protein
MDRTVSIRHGRFYPGRFGDEVFERPDLCMQRPTTYPMENSGRLFLHIILVLHLPVQRWDDRRTRRGSGGRHGR